MIEVTLIDAGGEALNVVNAARVSFKKRVEQMDSKQVNLLAYLSREGHMTPFNHAWMSFHVKAPVFVARQLVKHEYLPWNEVSRRYVDDEPTFFTPQEWRSRADNVKQGSGDTLVDVASDTAHSILVDHYRDCKQRYENLLEYGVCPEQARMVLPLGMMTEWIWSGSLGAFAKMVRLRIHPSTQAETREVAEKISDLAHDLFWHAWVFAVKCEE